MPSPHRTLTRGIASAAIRDHEFGRAPGTASDACARNGVGIELELLTDDGGAAGDHQRLTWERAEAVRTAVGPLPAGSGLTVEPGGQLEISTKPMPTLTDACQAAAHDLLVLDRSCAATGVGPYALGQDPVRPPRRVTQALRHRAMEAYFDAIGGAGRTMMTNTASIQLNVGLGDTEAEATRRWQVANAIGPAMAAAFANSRSPTAHPADGSRPACARGGSSTRRAPCRCRSRPVPTDRGVDGLRPGGAGHAHPHVRRRLPARRRADDLRRVDGRRKHAAGFPTIDDLRYHLTTLFPPVRPRLVRDPRHRRPTDPVLARRRRRHHHARDDRRPRCRRATSHRHSSDAEPTSDDLWVDASQLGLGHLAWRTAKDLFALASAALMADGCEMASELVDVYRHRWVDAGRSPADDAHDRWRTDGTLFPRRESPVPMDEVLAEVARS
ncbi:MAG: glutamate-cysteine ligase family protein [Acidimicrobiales bacterium]